ncbi:hypothetical protein ACFLQN_04835 [Candidatus Aenigmatarchaeota archaeon]
MVLGNMFVLELMKTMYNARTGMGGLVDKNPWLFKVPDRGQADRPRVAGRMPYSAVHSAVRATKSYTKGLLDSLDGLHQPQLQPAYANYRG